jgi:uncharacterized protein YjgD (DUF1641 family)
MARPIPFVPPRRDPREEFHKRLQEAHMEHAEAALAAYQVLQGLHDRGVLEMLRGALGASDKLLENVVEASRTPDSIRAIRNLLLLAKTLGSIEPELLNDLTQAVPKSRAPVKTEQAPPGYWSLLGYFRNKDFRRGLSVFTELLVLFGKNLSERKPEQSLDQKQ